MNERIKELVKTAGLNIDGYGYPIWGCLDGEDEKKAFLEKFAQLLISECAGIYDKIDNGNLHKGTDNYLEALHRTFRS
jgi:hypothetical protein